MTSVRDRCALRPDATEPLRQTRAVEHQNMSVIDYVFIK